MRFRIYQLFPLLLISCFFFACLQITGPKPRPSKTKTIQEKVDSVLALMTLEEKIGQLNQYNGFWEVTGPAPADGDAKKKYDQIKNGSVGSLLNVVGSKEVRKAQEIAMNNSRLKIPMVFAYDVIHGYQTMFPIPLGESASWDLEAIEKSARVAARETAASGLHWTFAPMMDVGRDARWGRVMEGAGEDPFLGSKIAVARVKGFQGDDLSDPNTIAACAKHFAGYGFSESGRDYNTVDINRSTLHNIVLPPFKAVADAGVATFMNSFNDLEGIPATGHKYLQRDLLKGEWGWDGMVVSDWGSIGEMIPHGYAKDQTHAAELALNAGSDMDMESRAYVNHLAENVKEGKVKESLIDDAVRRVLKLKFDLGLFDDPFKYCNEEKEKQEVGSKANLEAARDVAKRSIVLLKNQKNLLPLSKDLKSIAVIGPLANDKDVPLGSWRAHAKTNSAVSALEGIQAAVSAATEVKHAKGCDLAVGQRTFIHPLTISDKTDGFAEAVALAKSAEVVIMVIGEDCFQSGEGRSQVNIELPGVQQQLLEEVAKVNSNIVMVLMNGRPLAIPWAQENIPAIVEAWHLGSEAGNAIADVLFGDYNPSGKLPVSFPRSVGQVPIYYNHKNTGRPGPAGGLVFFSHFTDESNDPLYPFGHGLSYTTFKYGDLSIARTSMSSGGGSMKVSVEVTNTGNRAGEEVVQLYIKDHFGSTTRPVKELKGFQKIYLEPGESKEVSFRIGEEQLAFYTANNKWEVEPGDFTLYIGGDSKTELSIDFTIN